MKMKWLSCFSVLMVLGASVALACGKGSGIGFGLGKLPLFLGALAVGYWALTLSNTQKKPLDVLGRWIGGFIILVSIGAILVSIAWGLCGGSCGKGFGPKKMAVNCPMTGAGQPGSDPAAAK